MKKLEKAYVSSICLLLLVSSVFAQTITDAKKAIDAEQYQKAKSVLNKLLVSSPLKYEDYFYLGWIYLKQDYPDTAMSMFQKGIADNPKSALNYVGIGAVARADKNLTEVKADFDKAGSLSGKNAEPVIYMAEAYLLKPAPDPVSALALLNSKKNLSTNNPEYFIALGDAYRVENDNNNAYINYSQALTLNPKEVKAIVAIGALWKQAYNFEDGTQKLKDALAIDPSFSPAYRELAETDLLWAKQKPAMSAEKIKEGADYYKKYLDLTDRSLESEMRYADFLILARDYKTLEQVADDIAKSGKSNLRVYRYLAYSAYENKNYQAGLDAINMFIAKADPKRIIPRDYLYLGHLQIKTNQDSLGILTLQKAAMLDSNFRDDVNTEIAKIFYTDRKYAQAGDAYKNYIQTSHKAKLNDYFREGMSYYFAYSDQYFAPVSATTANKPKADSTLLVKADSAFSYVQQKTTARPIPDVMLYRARVKDMEDADRNNLQGFAKPFYEKFIALATVTPPTDDRTKKNLGEAYAYLGAYYEYKEKDDAKAAENFGKAKDINPDNKQAQTFFANKEATAKVK